MSVENEDGGGQTTLDRLDDDLRREWGNLTPDDRDIPTPNTIAEEAERRQLAGFFEGEGCISLTPKEANDAKLNHKISPELQLAHAELGGFAEAEGSITLKVQADSNASLENQMRPTFELQHNNEPGIYEKLNRYVELANGRGSVYRRDGRDKGQSATVRVKVSSRAAVRALLLKLYPWLGHKRRQARIMLGEILPRMERGEHLSKRGFIELMEWKEKLDEQKPMGDADRKYTADYFRDMWADDIETQTKLDDWDGHA